MPPTSRSRASVSLLLSFLSLGPNGLVLSHYVGLYSHVRSWEGARVGGPSPRGAFHQMTSPQVTLVVAGLISVAVLMVWVARHIIGNGSGPERVGLAASAVRFAGLALLPGGLEAVVLIGLLAARATLPRW